MIDVRRGGRKLGHVRADLGPPTRSALEAVAARLKVDERLLDVVPARHDEGAVLDDLLIQRFSRHQNHARRSRAGIADPHTALARLGEHERVEWLDLLALHRVGACSKCQLGRRIDGRRVAHDNRAFERVDEGIIPRVQLLEHCAVAVEFDVEVRHAAVLGYRDGQPYLQTRSD